MRKVIAALWMMGVGIVQAQVLRVDEATLAEGYVECDATAKIQRLCNGKPNCDVRVDGSLCPLSSDDQPMLNVRYRCGQDRYRVEAAWGQWVSLYCGNTATGTAPPPPPPVQTYSPPPLPVLEIREARYGLPGHGWCDATWSVANQCSQQSECNVRASNGWCGDPVPGEVKQMQIRYRCGWNERDIVIGEKQSDVLRCTPGDIVNGAGNQGLQVIQAEYGVDQRRCNARPALADRCDGDYRCSFKVGNQWCGDPARHQVKNLLIRWRCGWDVQEAVFQENQWAEISCMQRIPRHERPALPPPAHRHAVLHIHAARYGLLPNRVCDATATLARACNQHGQCSIKASNRLCGDPARNVKKTLFVDYSCGQQRQQRSVGEGQRLKLTCSH